MRKYIILTNGLAGVSGGIIYIRNKIDFMKKNGWCVNVAYANAGHIYIDDLKQHKNQFDFLSTYPAAYNNKQIDKFLNVLVDVLGCDEECIIETTIYRMACWGELLAQKCHGRHIICMLTENPYLDNYKFFEFYKFKYDNNELRGIASSSLQRLFKDYMYVPDDENCRVPAYCRNSIEYVDYSRWTSTYDYSIDYHMCTIGRIDKRYIIPMVEGVIRFIQRHNKTVQLYIFGGSYFEESKTKLVELLKKEPRLSYIITDFIFPVPAQLLEKMDVAIGAAGAAHALEQFGLPTISMDSQDGLPIGIMGLTTQDALYRKEKEVRALEDWLDEILISKVIEKHRPDPAIQEEYRNMMQRHMDWINELLPNARYFDTRKLVNEGTKITPLRMKCYRMFGKENIDRLRRYVLKKEEL